MKESRFYIKYHKAKAIGIGFAIHNTPFCTSTKRVFILMFLCWTIGCKIWQDKTIYE